MKLTERINQLVDKIGTILKEIKADIGHKSALKTTDKESVVGAVNELKDRIDAVGAGGNAAIDDTSPASAATVYSSQKTEQLIAAVKTEVRSEILDGAEAAYDTLKEVGEHIKQDKSGAAAMAQQIAARLRIDEAQILTPEQKTAVESTLNLGNTDADFVARFEQALK